MAPADEPAQVSTRQWPASSRALSAPTYAYLRKKPGAIAKQYPDPPLPFKTDPRNIPIVAKELVLDDTFPREVRIPRTRDLGPPRGEGDEACRLGHDEKNVFTLRVEV